MGRTSTLWIVNVFLETEQIHLFKTLEFHTLKDIAYCLDTEVYQVSNFYHKITKPSGVFKFLYIYKALS